MNASERKKYKGYIKYSRQRFGEPFMKELEDRVLKWDALLEEHTKNNDQEGIEMVSDLLKGNIQNVIRLQQQMIDDMVDDSLCDSDGLYVDKERYYEDCIGWKRDQISNIDKLLDQNIDKNKRNELNNKKANLVNAIVSIGKRLTRIRKTNEVVNMLDNII